MNIESLPEAEPSPIRDWLIEEVYLLKGRRGAKEEINDNTLINLREPILSAFRSHFMMHFGDLPFNEKWMSMTVGEAVTDIESKLIVRKHPPQEEFPKAA